MNEINIVVHAQEDVSQTFDDMGASVRGTGNVVQRTMADTEDAFDTAARSTGSFGAALDKAAGFGANMSDGLQGVSDVTGSVNELMSVGERRAEEYAQAQQDVEQAIQDGGQALRDFEQAVRDAAQSQLDGKQAAIDVEQAQLDQTTAQKALNAAIKEHGKGSDEARQAAIDLSQAGLDLAQAQEDAKQATQDGLQANEDMHQSRLDGKQAALDEAAALRELQSQSSTLGKVSEYASLLSGVLGGLVGIIGAVTAVQWAWNTSLLANPIVLIIVAIIALVAIIVIIATKTTWFQSIWNAVWGAIGDPVKAVFDFIVAYYKFVFNVFTTIISTWYNVFVGFWKRAIDFALRYFSYLYSLPGKLKSAFSKVGEILYAPFKYGFNMIARGWNSSVGRLHWSVPNWVPLIGGNSMSVPNIPMLQRGGEVTQTGLALVHKGERVLSAGTRGLSGMGGTIVGELHFAPGTDREFMEWIEEKLSLRIRAYGAGNVQEYLGSR